MPSTQPRLALTLPDDLREVLSDYAEAQTKPVATVVVELLNGLKPQLRDLTRLLRAVKAGELQLAADISRQAWTGAAITSAAAQQELEGLVAAVPAAAPAAVSTEGRTRKTPAKGRRGA